MSGFLDKKDRIFDIRLTDKGRELLSKNQLDFTWFAFSDDLVDYSGSIDDVLKSTGSLDDYMQKLFINEANQQKTPQNKDLKNFLFTAPPGSNILPEFRISLTGSINLKRKFKTMSFIDAIKNKNDGNLSIKTSFDTGILDKSKSYLITQQASLAALKGIISQGSSASSKADIQFKIDQLKIKLDGLNKNLKTNQDQLDMIKALVGGVFDIKKIELKNLIKSLQDTITQKTNELNALISQLEALG